MFMMKPLISGWPHLMIEDLLIKINEKYLVNVNRRFTIMELSKYFLLISRSLVNTILMKKLNYLKFCARWVPKIFTYDYTKQKLAALLTFLEDYHKYCNKLFVRIVTRDETLVKSVNCEIKRQSMEWGHTHFPKKSKNVFILHQSEILWQIFFGTLRV